MIDGTPRLRAVRLNRLQELLRARRDGYTARELADLSGVHVRTIERDLLVLQTEAGLPLVVERGRYALLDPPRLPPLRLNVQEARALLLAMRLFLRYSDEADPFSASALEKLAAAMPDPVRAQLQATAAALARRPLDPGFSQHLMTITDAWTRRRLLHLVYRSAGKTRAKEVVVEPYFLEPSAAGLATYLIGYSRTHGTMRTFKVERVTAASMLPESFDLRPDIDVDSLLASAWGIIWGDGQQVVLRFAPAVSYRVRESRWHPSQLVEDLPDGGCLLTISVASLAEVGRWVRGWGDQVEVLAPADLRRELRDESIRIARQYAAPAKAPRRARPAATPDANREPGSVA
ncbi:MAG TPA: WYL domain-containing transcriptional regulator [Dehalococcoidia bacterium]|nr:WYL domain-containing transcriptional regulator [Dehalococcoidia bacterium]